MNVGSRNSTGPVQATRKRISHNSQKSFGCSDALIRERAPALDAFTIHGRDIPHHLPSPSPTTFANTANCQQTLNHSTLKISLYRRNNVIIIIYDKNFSPFIECSTRMRNATTDHVTDL